MHPLFLLAIGTFVLIFGFLIWTRISTGRHRFGPNNPHGVGGESDPLSGAREDLGDPDVMRAALDNAHRIRVRRPGVGRYSA
jgi:hypothetical protein